MNNKKAYYITAATLFLIVAVLHLIRAIKGWEMLVSGTEIPVWLSYVVGGLLLYLSVRGFRKAKMMR